MKYTTVSDDISREHFNSVAHHPLQSFEWGEVRQKTGLTVIRVGEYDNDRLTNVFTMTIHPIPYTAYSVGYIPRSVLPTPELLSYCQELGHEYRLICIKFEPYEESNTVNNDRIKVLSESASFLRSPHPLFPEWTQILDLSPNEDTLLAQMKPKTRYNIRVAQKKGVTVREVAGDEGFDTFSRLYFQTTTRQQYKGHNRTYHKTIWDHLKNQYAHILVAYFEYEPLSAYELFLYKDVLFYPYGGSSTLHRDKMGSNLLMWEAIRFGKRHGARKFDMWGSLPQDYDRNGKWAGFTRFKEGYGTSFVKFVGSFDLVISHPLYSLYSIAYKIRSKLL